MIDSIVVLNFKSSASSFFDSQIFAAALGAGIIGIVSIITALISFYKDRRFREEQNIQEQWKEKFQLKKLIFEHRLKAFNSLLAAQVNIFNFEKLYEDEDYESFLSKASAAASPLILKVNEIIENHGYCIPQSAIDKLYESRSVANEVILLDRASMGEDYRVLDMTEKMIAAFDNAIEIIRTEIDATSA